MPKYEQRLEVTMTVPLGDHEDPPAAAKALEAELSAQFPLAKVKVEWNWTGTIERG